MFFVIWSGLLVMAFTRRLRRGLDAQINSLAAELAEVQMSRGLFPQLEEACRNIERDRQRLDAIAVSTNELRNRLATSRGLGAPVGAELLPSV